MAYTMLKKQMSEMNIYDNVLETGRDLKDLAIRFLHNTCEELRFDGDKSGEDGPDSYTGRSSNIKQIPYNMEMDIDRLCLENSLMHFLESGTSQDAFNVYLCYIDMFMGSYGKSRHIIEMLSEFESNGSSLLMKHRDHYSHSVYVFALGLAVFESNTAYKEVYRKYYGFNSDRMAAHHYLKFWGLTSLFHDIGYPFELPFEEICGYFESDRDYDDDKELKGKKTARYNRPYMAYHDVEKYIELSVEQSKKLQALYGLEKDAHFFATTNDLFAYDLENKLGKVYRFSKDSMSQILGAKPTRPDLFNNFMDHAFWSATILFRELYETIGIYSKENDEGMDKVHVDALTAILLHNSLYKFSIGFIKSKDVNIPFRMEYHPLAYMLMLCDELQCWDRTSYGRNSRIQFHPMDCRFTFGDGDVKAVYIFDEAGNDKIERYKKGEIKKLKSYSDFDKGDFLGDIKEIIALGKDSGISIEVSTDVEKRDTLRKHTYLSESNFIHLYDFAVVLNARYKFMYASKSDLGADIPTYNEIKGNQNKQKEFYDYITSDEGIKKAEEWFEKELSLEYKLSNINQAKGFAKGLDILGAFYTDRPVDFELYERISDEDSIKIGPMEHFRWLKEHEEMGWTYVDGENYDRENGEGLYKEKRELKRFHTDMVPAELMQGKTEIDETVAKANYDRLEKGEQDKDTEPMDLMMVLLPAYEGVRFYKYK